MHIHLPKPLHGWREFLGEVGIIVLGVLIALAAEQAVEAWHWRGETHELKTALDAELSQNILAFRYRIEQEPCVTARIALLEGWRASAGHGRSARLVGEIGRPAADTMNASVWNGRSSEAMAHMPLAETARYSRFYDEMATVQRLMLEERDAWASLNAFDGATAPPPGEAALRLSELLYRVRALDRVLQTNWRPTLRDGTQMGLRTTLTDAADDLPPATNGAFCQPLRPVS